MTQIRETFDDVKKENRWYFKALIAMSVILLTFGIMAQILSEMMGYTPFLTYYFMD